MNTVLRKSEDRGKGEYGWLSARYSFSFASYYDPKFTGFGDLRVINQDVIDPGAGFGTHPHNNMEIVTYIIEGAIEHKDSLGNVGQITKGEIQRMTAGSGIQHSEYNPDKKNPTKLLQIWIDTNQKNIDPDWEEKKIDTLEGLHLIVSEKGGENVLRINQDVKIYAGKFSSPFNETLPLDRGRKAWIQMISGELTANGQILSEGDGLGLEDLSQLELSSDKETHFLLFDLR